MNYPIKDGMAAPLTLTDEERYDLALLCVETALGLPNMDDEARWRAIAVALRNGRGIR